ncbi:MAG: activator of photopigment and puc with BLUF domain protein [Alphaproteobacteria bacterium HGW-Alphaproteobacteria-15]|nr:MAG: activator of photopigment and puc with BLUF domain protein [Alphaproteobacteria bacterium HGW-Alphaproteobacteria-15]
MKQILYASVSSRTDGHPVDIFALLEQSRHNNAIDGITGLLWTDGHRFLQVIEGDDTAADACFARIRADDRHTAIVVILERPVQRREFGYWAMAHKTRHEMADVHDHRIRRMMENAAEDVRAPFLELISTREVA